MSATQDSLHSIVLCSPYPPEAFEFVERALAYTVRKIHGESDESDQECRHVSGRDLCFGLRELAWVNYGLLARPVLRAWKIQRTEDIGAIVYHMIEHGVWKSCPSDRRSDFSQVFDFSTLESDYTFGKYPCNRDRRDL